MRVQLERCSQEPQAGPEALQQNPFAFNFQRAAGSVNNVRLLPSGSSTFWTGPPNSRCWPEGQAFPIPEMLVPLACTSSEATLRMYTTPLWAGNAVHPFYNDTNQCIAAYILNRAATPWRRPGGPAGVVLHHFSLSSWPAPGLQIVKSVNPGQICFFSGVHHGPVGNPGTPWPTPPKAECTKTCDEQKLTAKRSPHGLGKGVHSRVTG